MTNLDALASSDSTGQMPSMEQAFEYWHEVTQGDDFNFARDFGMEVQAAMDSIEHVIAHLRRSTLDRLFRTEKGYLGMGPVSVLPGDEVWVLAGARVPFVLRRCRLLGQCYVHGLMHGEGLPSENPDWDHIELE